VLGDERFWGTPDAVGHLFLAAIDAALLGVVFGDP